MKELRSRIDSIAPPNVRARGVENDSSVLERLGIDINEKRKHTRRDQVMESITGFISAHAEFEMSVGHPAGAGQGSGGGLGLKL